MSEELEWLVYSREHNAFWRPNASGYTWDINAAGRYTKADADKHCDTRDPQFDGGPSEIAIVAPEAAADRDHWKGQATKNHSQTLEAMQENDRLRGLALQAEDLIERASQQWPAEDERWPVFREWKAALGEQDGNC